MPWEKMASRAVLLPTRTEPQRPAGRPETDFVTNPWWKEDPENLDEYLNLQQTTKISQAIVDECEEEKNRNW
jgi:hypothetical protein